LAAPLEGYRTRGPIGDARYDTGPARGQRAAEVDELIASWTREHSKVEAMKIL
jgi:crotonobetainyl-CoA:carnitine CoA-transferase CaiB-like acyl-CoA transferase